MELESNATQSSVYQFYLGHVLLNVITMGCAHNQADSDQIYSAFVANGAQLAMYDNSNVVYVNSCTVKTPSEEKAFYYAEKALEQGKIVVFGGCVSQAIRNLPRLQHSVEQQRCFIVGVLDGMTMQRLFGVLQNPAIFGGAYVLASKSLLPVLRDVYYDVSVFPLIRSRRNVDVIPLCVGCLGECTYCQTLHARGRLVSYPVDSLVRRVSAALASTEITELWFTGEDTLAWGQEQGKDFADLWQHLRPLLQNTTVMVRIGMTDPESVVGREIKLAELLRDPHVYKFLHLPIYSASDNVLKTMKRRYTVQQYRYLLSTLRQAIPDVAIATDYITGFPGETDEDHRLSVVSLYKLNFDVVNVTQYYPRAHTPALLMEYVPQSIKRIRSAELHKAALVDFYVTRRCFVKQIHNVSVLEVLKKPQFYRLFGCKTINQITVALEWFYDDTKTISENVTQAEESGVRIGSIVCCEIVEVTRVGLVGRFICVCKSGELVGRVDANYTH